MMGLRPLLAVAALLGLQQCRNAGAPVRSPSIGPAVQVAALPPLAGFTELKPSADTRTIYVSSSQGNDDNSGLTTAAPLRTVAAGVKHLRDGKPDWLLLRKGDAWRESLGHWLLSGRSAAEPLVVASYGPSGARPLLKTGGNEALSTTGAEWGPPANNHLAFVGLHFYANTRDPRSPEFISPEDVQGVTWLRGTKDLLFEDCVFQSYTVGIVLLDADHFGISNVRLRRNLIVDSYGTRDSHSQGVYADGVDGLLIEECVFDHNGWNDSPKVPGSEATIFNHHVYIQTTCKNVTVRDSIFLRASSHGVQLRPGGTAVGNLFVRNPIGLLLGGGDHPIPGGVTATAVGNVIMEGNDISENLPRGVGIDLDNIKSATLQDNMIVHAATRGKYAAAIARDPNARYANNVVCDWGKSDFDTPDECAKPSRSVAAYAGLHGDPATFDGFIAAVRAQSRDHWRGEYAARAINAFIRTGARGGGSKP